MPKFTLPVIIHETMANNNALLNYLNNHSKPTKQIDYLLLYGVCGISEFTFKICEKSSIIY